MPPHGDHLRALGHEDGSPASGHPVPHKYRVSWMPSLFMSWLSLGLLLALGRASIIAWVVIIVTALDACCRKGTKLGLFDTLHLIVYGFANVKLSPLASQYNSNVGILDTLEILATTLQNG